ncbi:2-phosphosulfolactate phosphatase [Terracoccus luteus]|uniref:Probable 2-phosphosulfolactate phosphatase n=1 Tax=Terracoccus luteus TaxID=53356 RepID=A0A839Q5Y2_9MICO|nr:2-phosphosulfolactate phosphatase [Terracoccus luteus]MBB2988041.1 2-phosphosulfolactate phosphatase [Terracoccus luteus]MCP2173692.1 2-phosphosulfolactate phosphatase [Terracoccus luteus]
MMEPVGPRANSAHLQQANTVRLEWGPPSVALVADAVARGERVLAVVVDVLSFTTTVSVALDRGARVHPYRWADGTAAAFAAEHGAVLAVGRRQAAGDPAAVSLSPGSVRRAEALDAVVLPSPNGSTVTGLLADAGAEVVAASLRTRAAVGRWLVDRLVRSAGHPTALVVVPAGERWADGSLRPAVEDLWGAGAVVAAVVDELEHRAGPLLLSPEARAALAAWDVVADDVGTALRASASGVELVEAGFGDDVDVAAELDASDLVPLLVDGAFTDATGSAAAGAGHPAS